MTKEKIEQLANEMHNLFNLFTSWEHSILRSGDLSVTERHAIEILGIDGNMNMKSLAERLAVTRGTVTAIVDKLEQAKYAKRKMMAEDRRAYMIELTPKGKKAFAEHHKHHLNLIEEIMPLLSKEDADTLIKILQKLNKHLFP